MATENEHLITSALKYFQEIQRSTKPCSQKEIIAALKNLLRGLINTSQTKDISEAIITIVTPEKKEEINILEDCGYLFHHICESLFQTINKETLNEYLSASLDFFTCTSISEKLKIQLLDSENRFGQEILFNTLSKFPHGGESSLARYKLATRGIKPHQSAIFNKDKETLIAAARIYIGICIDHFVLDGKLIQASASLQELLKDATTAEEKLILITALINHATEFNLISQAELKELLFEYEEIIPQEQQARLQSKIEFKPGAIIVEGLKFTQGNLSIQTTANRSIATVIQLSIPHKIKQQNSNHLAITEKISINTHPINSFWADPMFTSMRTLRITDMGWSYFCDIEPEHGSSYTHIQIVVDDLFIPDIVLTDKGNNNIDFSEKEALTGRRHYPHKEFIVKTLLNNFSQLSSLVEIEKKEVNINLFSNYFIDYLDKSNGNLIHRRIYAITNPSSFSTATTRFIDRLNSANLSNSLISIRDLLTNTKIETEKSLAEFTHRSIDIFVKHNIEQHGGYRYLWKSDLNGNLVPRREAESQPYIFSHLRAIFDFMGIQISREVESSNGEIDFLVSYTNSSKQLLRLCVELKLAHANKVEDGITLQLPAYMRGERCKYGVYVVLWYKGEGFEKPTFYRSSQELDARIKEINQNSRIFSLVINCTKPQSPSKL